MLETFYNVKYVDKGRRRIRTLKIESVVHNEVWNTVTRNTALPYILYI